MDELDRALINALQEGIEVCSRPFQGLAEALGIGEREVVERLGALLERGVLSRFGPMLDIERAGGSYCLCAMAVPPGEVEEIAGRVNGFEAVAHNYLREHRLNLWFVLACETPAEVEDSAAAIERACGHPVLRLPKIEEFYVGLRLEA